MQNASFFQKIASWVSALFYLTVTFLIFFNPLPTSWQTPEKLRSFLFSGKNPPVAFDSEFAVFKPFLPPNEKVSILMDTPFSPYDETSRILYTAQSFLTPTVVAAGLSQRAALIYCSDSRLAEKRLKETGYRLALPLSNGKGIAVKLPPQ